MQSKTRFCNFVYSNPYAQTRIDFFLQLSRYKAIDAPGKCMNNMSAIAARTYEITKEWWGSDWEQEKIEFLKPYKFTIAFENSSHPGYTTEKLIDAFAANTIPIYWGDPLVGTEFNPKAFINCHDYQDFDAVIKRIIEIDNDDDLYRQYISEPALLNNKQPEYLNEDSILDRFEAIFSNPIFYASRRFDSLKWYRYRLEQNGFECFCVKLKQLLGLSTRRFFNKV